MAEQQAAPAFTQEQRDIMKAQTKRNFDYWTSVVTPAQEAMAAEEIAKYTSGDQEYITEAMGKIGAAFAAADLNNDGRLDAAEHEAFFVTMMANDAAEGKFSSMYDGGMAD